MLPNLHDATLTSVTIDWQQRSGELQFLTPPDKAIGIIRFFDFTLVSIPCDQAWGRSNSVNSAVIVPEDNQNKLTVEMQSGDVIVVSASRFNYGV